MAAIGCSDHQQEPGKASGFLTDTDFNSDLPAGAGDREAHQGEVATLLTSTGPSFAITSSTA